MKMYIFALFLFGLNYYHAMQHRKIKLKICGHLFFRINISLVENDSGDLKQKQLFLFISEESSTENISSLRIALLGFRYLFITSLLTDR